MKTTKKNYEEYLNNNSPQQGSEAYVEVTIWFSSKKV
jgi:hypothetical protein